MFALANHYYNGVGTEKNFEKAFHWCQKAAENDNIDAMFTNHYGNGEGTEKNLAKAFVGIKKQQKKDHIDAMFAACYGNGVGTEKNLEKVFYWYQKAADKDYIDAMYAACYRNGEGTERNLERAFYWHQILVESNKTNPKNKVEFCNECKLPNSDYQWCQQCNTKRFQQDFSKWTSKNKFIDEFVQEAQSNAKNSYEILEWIPYNNLSSIDYYDRGGFSEIHKAIWLDGPIFSWNSDKQQWNRQTCYVVILKTLNNSSSLNNEFLNEWKYHYNCQKKSFQNLFRLKVIHESNLIHGDFHDGNILMSDNYNELFIIDLGLCKPTSVLQNSGNKVNEIYGVLPYMAPEILRKKPYTPASDIYSSSMIMWELTSGIPPFNHEAHDHHFILSVYEGKRPKIMENTPKCYIDLMKKCWDLNPSNRPTIIMLENIISEWVGCINKYYEINKNGNYKFLVPNIDNQLKNDLIEFIEANESLMQNQANTSIIQYHPQACYTSRKLTEILVQEESQGFDCKIEDD
ncbi:unnamed protein product [Rhizophagus irregularis]|nr:unnamed protein product [Rhizophagus irregularis]